MNFFLFCKYSIGNLRCQRICIENECQNTIKCETIFLKIALFLRKKLIKVPQLLKICCSSWHQLRKIQPSIIDWFYSITSMSQWPFKSSADSNFWLSPQLSPIPDRFLTLPQQWGYAEQRAQSARQVKTKNCQEHDLYQKLKTPRGWKCC